LRININTKDRLEKVFINLPDIFNDWCTYDELRGIYTRDFFCVHADERGYRNTSESVYRKILQCAKKEDWKKADALTRIANYIDK
jgi:hypothetical protein